MTTDILLLNETQLTRLEQRVKDGLHSFVDVGNALIEIREGKGYRVRGYKTFEIYCEKVFGFTDRHGRRMIAAAETAKAVQDVVGQAPATESVARELAGVANDPIVIQKVADRLERKKSSIATATAETMAEVVAAVTGKKSKATTDPIRHSGNGHKAEATPEATPAVVNDVCPNCKTTPDRYSRNKNMWICGGCGQPVALHVSAISLTHAINQKRCRTCNNLITPGARMCSSCGEVVR